MASSFESSSRKVLRYHHRVARRYQISLWLLALGSFALLLGCIRIFFPFAVTVYGMTVYGMTVYGSVMLVWAVLSAILVAVWGRGWAQRQALQWLDKTIGLSYRSALEYLLAYESSAPPLASSIPEISQRESSVTSIEAPVIAALQRRVSLKVQGLALPQPRAWWLPVWIVALLLAFVPHMALPTWHIGNHHSNPSSFEVTSANPREKNRSNPAESLQATSSSQAEQATLEDFLESIPEPTSANTPDDISENTPLSEPSESRANLAADDEGAAQSMNPFAPVGTSVAEAPETQAAQPDTADTGVNNEATPTTTPQSSSNTADISNTADTANDNLRTARDIAANSAAPLESGQEEAGQEEAGQEEVGQEEVGQQQASTEDEASMAGGEAQADENEATSQQEYTHNATDPTASDSLSEAKPESTPEGSSESSPENIPQTTSGAEDRTAAEQQGKPQSSAAGVSHDEQAGDGATAASVTARERLGGTVGESSLLEAAQNTGERVAIGSAEGEQVLRLDETRQQLDNLPSFADISENIVNEGSIPNEYHEVLRRYFK